MVELQELLSQEKDVDHLVSGNCPLVILFCSHLLSSFGESVGRSIFAAGIHGADRAGTVLFGMYTPEQCSTHLSPATKALPLNLPSPPIIPPPLALQSMGVNHHK